MKRMKRKNEDPKMVGGIVESALAELGIAERVKRAEVVAGWRELVGPRIAEVAQAVGVKGETLFVAVESAAWRNELSLMRPRLLAKLNAGRSEGRIERIVFLQGDRGNPEEADGQEQR
ncbi:MAG: DciA family protein [Gemmatimonadota bacterium]